MLTGNFTSSSTFSNSCCWFRCFFRIRASVTWSRCFSCCIDVVCSGEVRCFWNSCKWRQDLKEIQGKLPSLVAHRKCLDIHFTMGAPQLDETRPKKRDNYLVAAVHWVASILGFSSIPFPLLLASLHHLSSFSSFVCLIISGPLQGSHLFSVDIINCSRINGLSIYSFICY